MCLIESRLVPLVLMSLFVVSRVDIAHGLQCQRISTPLCQGLGYNMTALPNLAGHATQEEAEEAITKLLPLVESECSERVRFLICSSLFPLCSPDVPRPVTACKELCETIEADCMKEPTVVHLWPSFLICKNLPHPDNQELCMQIPQEKIQIPPQQNTYWPWFHWKSSHPLKSIPKIICPVNYTAANEVCIPQCDRDVLYSSHQKKVTETLILSLAAICFIVTLFSLVTFWAEPTRFGYPERPVLFLVLSYNLISVCNLEGIVFHSPGRDAIAEENSSCALSPPCLASYITTSYLTLSATTWWLIFALCYYLSSNKRWSSEALEKKSGLFHVLAWVPPLAPPISALLWGAIKPHELTGICTAPGFVEIPALMLLTSGAIFTILASRSLQGLQEQLRIANDSQRFSQVRKRILIFSILYFVPATLSIVLTFFEKLENEVPPCLSPESCEIPTKNSSTCTILRLICHFVAGSLTGMWVWSRKTCESYRNRITASPPVTQVKKPKPHIQSGPLYSGINFHNVPLYSDNHSRV